MISALTFLVAINFLLVIGIICGLDDAEAAKDRVP